MAKANKIDSLRKRKRLTPRAAPYFARVLFLAIGKPQAAAKVGLGV